MSLYFDFLYVQTRYNKVPGICSKVLKDQNKT